MLCKVGAKELSDALKPTLDSHDVRLVGIGVETLGLQQFLEGNFFAGEMFIDTKKECYKRLAYKRYNVVSILPAIFGSSGRAAIAKARAANVGNNYEGDGMQNGGVLIVSPGGEKTLLSWSQPDPGTHIDPKIILDTLQIQ